MQPMGGSGGGMAARNNKPRGHRLEVNVGHQKRNGEHWNVRYTKNPDEHKINVQAGHEKPNGRHWSVDYTHDMGWKN